MQEKTFFVMVKGLQPIVVTVKDNESRPREMDAHSVLEQWVTENYDFKEYDYWDIGAYLKVNIH